MHVYLVRHGETLLNRKHVHQFPNTPISEKGNEEAHTAGELLRPMHPTAVISSTHTRALETARIIGQCTGITPESSSYFYEILRPASLHGKSHFTSKTIWYVILSVLHRNNSKWRFEDAENMHDLILRTQQAKVFLEKLDKNHDSIVVVSHSVFINFLSAHLCNPNALSFFELSKTFLRVVFTRNASVVHVQYLGKTKNKNACVWLQH